MWRSDLDKFRVNKEMPSENDLFFRLNCQHMSKNFCPSQYPKFVRKGVESRPTIKWAVFTEWKNQHFSGKNLNVCFECENNGKIDNNDFSFGSEV